MRAFVTGSTGLLGSNLVRQLRAAGHEVTVLARSAEKARRSFAGLDVRTVIGDIANVAGFAPALAGHDTLFHTAAYFREYFQPGDHWATLKALNVDATIELLRAAEAQGLRRVVHTSSSGTLGKGDPADELTPPDELVFNNLYFRSKLAADQAIQEYLAAGSRLHVTMAMPGWMFGPGDSGPTTAGQMVIDLLNRRIPVIIPGYGAVTDVRDVADGMIRMAERGRSGERYVLAGPRAVSFQEIIRLVGELGEVATPTLRAPRWFAFSYAWLSETYGRISGRPVLATMDGLRTIVEPHPLSSAKAIGELGASFRPVRDTLRDTIAWYRAERPELVPAGQAAANPA